MADVILRFDMRCPEIATVAQADLYQAAIDMCSWGDERGIGSVHLSEHHGSEDGYCPSPLVFASAIATRTSNMRIFISALIAPLHDPVQLAEDLTVLDIISRGRVIPVISGGYREEEFNAVGKKLSVRRQYMNDIGAFLKKAWSGETFQFEGRTITITPKPFSDPRPMILMGGSSRPAARRAAADADFFHRMQVGDHLVAVLVAVLDGPVDPRTGRVRGGQEFCLQGLSEERRNERRPCQYQ